MSIYLLLPFIGFVLTAILGLITLFRDQKSLIHRTFALFLLFGALWDLAIFGMRASPNMEGALIWEKAVMGIVALATVFLYHFSVVYSNSRLQRAYVVIMYLVPVVVAVVSVIGLVMPSMQRMPYGWAPVPGPLFLPVIASLYVFSILTLRNLLKAYKTAATHIEKNRAGYLIVGLCFSLVGAVFDLLPLVGLPLYPGAMIGNIVFAALASIAILRHHLLDIHIVVRKSVAYFVMSILVAVPYAGAIFLLSELLGRRDINAWVHVLLLLVLSLALQPMWSRIQILVDKWFYRERWEHFKALEQFSHETRDITDLGYLADSLISLVSQAMQTECSCLLLLDSGRRRFTMTSSYGLPDNANFSFSCGSALVSWLDNHGGFLERRALDIQPQLQAVTMRERDAIDLMKARLLIPLKAARVLIGILVVGPKLSGQAFSEDDLRLLRVVSQQMAITLDNARLYGDLKQTYDELRGIQERLLVQSEKLRALGEMTSGIAHNFNNTLTVILGRAQLSLAQMGGSKERHNIELIEQSALDAAKMIRKLQDFARVPIDKGLDIVDLNELLRSSVEFIKPRLDEQCQTLGSSIDLELRLHEIGRVEGFETELKEALINILINAIEAMPGGGKLSIASKQDGQFVAVSIADTGAGMTGDVQRRVFDPFFTTKGVRGLGMGLSIVRSTIERHQGQITVSSEPGRGSTFNIKIPVTVKSKWKEAPAAAGRIDANDAAILVVDDDKGPRDVIHEILTRAGYRVDIATGGKDGLSMARQKDYNLVLADLGMPDMSGWDLASAIRTGNSSTLVVLVTGWGVQIDKTRLKERGIYDVIAKPFSRESVLSIVGTALGGRTKVPTANS